MGQILGRARQSGREVAYLKEFCKRLFNCLSPEGQHDFQTSAVVKRSLGSDRPLLEQLFRPALDEEGVIAVVEVLLQCSGPVKARDVAEQMLKQEPAP
jgi:hypothetical protein